MVGALLVNSKLEIDQSISGLRGLEIAGASSMIESAAAMGMMIFYTNAD